jgi:hypothetical protein
MESKIYKTGLLIQLFGSEVTLYLAMVHQDPHSSQRIKDHFKEKLSFDTGEIFSISICIKCTYTLQKFMVSIKLFIRK